MRLFKSKIICAQLTHTELLALEEDFKSYKSTESLPRNFGRDELYDHPNTLPIVKAESVRHIHLEDAKHPWPVFLDQFHKTSDVHLVYCESDMTADCYLLMAILSPNAHALARNNNWMFKLGKMAEAFRQRY